VRPKGGVGDNYTKCTNASFADNKHVKSIVNTNYVLPHAWSPHAFVYKKGYNAVNTDKQTVIGPFNIPPTYTGWHVNHYVIKSLEDYKAKRARGGGNDPNLKKARGN
jgi:hypothetical protein